MKAVQIHSYGHADQLKVEEVERPKLQAHQVLVKVFDAGVNPVDWKIREGRLKAVRPQHFPVIMGQDFAGIIEDTGPEVSRFQKGDRVYGTANGSYAEFVAVDESRIARIPSSVDLPSAASVPTAGLTAFQIIKQSHLSKGTVLLIQGAAGGVGSFAVQLAAARGAHIIATGAAVDKDYLQELGADEFIDFEHEDFEAKVKDVDVVIDLVGGDTLKRSFHVVKPGGQIITTVGPLDANSANEKNIQTLQFLMKPNSEDLAEVAKLLGTGELKVHIHEVFPLAEARRAQETLEKGHARGKFILQVSH